MGGPGRSWLKPALFAAGAGALLAAGIYFDVAVYLRSTLAWVERAGWAGMGLFALLYVAACLLFLPGALLTAAAGILFGVVKGTAIVSVSSTLGATAAFLAGRYLAREWVSRKIEKRPLFAAVDEAVAREGWKIVGLTRLSPLFPFNLLNYAFGLTRVTLREYVFASWAGMLPGTVLYVYLGSLAGNLAALGGGAGGRRRSAAEWMFWGAGFLAALAAAYYVTRTARRALAEKIGKGAENG